MKQNTRSILRTPIHLYVSVFSLPLLFLIIAMYRTSNRTDANANLKDETSSVRDTYIAATILKHPYTMIAPGERRNKSLVFFHPQCTLGAQAGTLAPPAFHLREMEEDLVLRRQSRTKTQNPCPCLPLTRSNTVNLVARDYTSTPTSFIVSCRAIGYGAMTLLPLSRALFCSILQQDL